MRVGELLRLAAAAYPGGLERFEKYWNFSRGRAREGSGDLLVAFVVTELLLQLNGFELTASDDDLPEDAFADWLRRHVVQAG